MIPTLNFLGTQFKLFFRPKSHWFVAISGGQDSTILMILSQTLKSQWDASCTYFYCNHLWRIQSFYTQAQLLKIHYLFQTSNLTFVCCQDVQTELTARIWRLFSYSIAIRFINKRSKAAAILLGHTKSDILETFLFQLSRGMSPQTIYTYETKRQLEQPKSWIFEKKRIKIQFFQGKKNNQQKTKVYIIRPCLTLNRYEIYHLCNSYRIPVLCDLTNFKIYGTRNQIRHQLVPLLRTYFNPQIDIKLSQFLCIGAAENDYVNCLVRNIIKKLNILYFKKGFCFQLGLFQKIPLAIQKRLLIRLLQKSPSTNILTFYNIEQIVKLCLLPQRKKILVFCLNKQLFILITPNLIIFFWVRWDLNP